MSSPTSFRAPWSGTLKLISILSTAVMAAVGVTVASSLPRQLAGGLPFTLAMAVLWGTLLVSALFTVRGYSLTPSELLVQRLLWSTAIPLRDLQAAWADPEAMKGSIRVIGNGGLFAWSGLFANRRLGRYRALATDPARAVVLRFAERKLVVTPSAPHAFLHTLGL
jgi:Bacterial PH domain